MLQIRSIKVRSFDLAYLDVFWEIEPSYEDAANYEFELQRSEAQFGPFDPVVSGVVDSYHVRDHTVRGRHDLYWSLFYRIQVKDRRSAETRTFPEDGSGVRLDAAPDLMALEMARQENLKLREFKGRQVWIYPRRRSGQRCSVCFDHVQQRRVRSNCPTCYNTGFVGGFHTPVIAYMQIVSPTERTLPTQHGKVAVEATQFLLGNYPLLHSGDMVIEGENIRWKVGDDLVVVRKGRSPIRQQGILSRVLPDDVWQRVPVAVTDDELAVLETSPERNFTNPQTPGSLSKAVKAIDAWFKP